MKIFTINGREYTAKTGLKALMKFEELTGRNAFKAENNVTDNVTMFYSLLSADKNFNYRFDEFIEVVDEEPELLEQFTAYMLELVEVQKDELKKKLK